MMTYSYAISEDDYKKALEEGVESIFGEHLKGKIVEANVYNVLDTYILVYTVKD